MFDKDDSELVKALRHAALPLKTAADLDPLMEAIGDAGYILLGEASHGTHDFYTWRAEISKRLILEKKCAFIAVEGDWPDCYRVNRYVKGYPDSGTSAREVLHAFDRWPTWMWANQEIVELVEWLHQHNKNLSPEQKVGFYGLDVYSLWDSMEAVVNYLETIDPAFAETARRAYLCFEPYGKDAQAYARATVMVPASCEDEALSVLHKLKENAPEYRRDGPDAYYNAEQNAYIAQGAEKYYRAMMRGSAASWNVRDQHMVETLERLMAHHGTHAKAIVWEHNTHVGDARFTDMAEVGMVNVGQLVRQNHPDPGQVFLVGFGCYSGSVVAASRWGAPMQVMRVPEAHAGSPESLMHLAGQLDNTDTPQGEPFQNMLFIFDGTDDGGIPDLDDPRGHRAIGVVYDPDAERWGNYVPTIVPLRYDAFLFIDRSTALDALHMQAAQVARDAPETYPSGM